MAQENSELTEKYLAIGSTFPGKSHRSAVSGLVTLRDYAAQSATMGTFSFQTHLFQTTVGQLPKPIYGVDPNSSNTRWGWLAG